MSNKKIQVKVSAVITNEQKAFFQDDIGNMLFFTKDHMRLASDFENLQEGSLISVELDDQNNIIAVNLEGLEEGFDADALDYLEPNSFLLLGEPPLADYLLIDYGKYVLAKGDKDIDKAKQRLIDLCKELGANSIIDFKIKKERKNVMGFGFIYYYATGIPAIVATQSKNNGQISLNELQQKLNKKQIAKLGNMFVNVRIGKIVLQILAIVLFIVFAIGFIYSK